MSMIIENNVLIKHTDEFGMTEAIIPENVDEVNNDAFIDSTELECVWLPDHMSSIPCGAFWGCCKLKNVVLYKNDVSVTVILERIHFFGQLLSFISAPNLNEKEMSFIRMNRGDIRLPLSVFLAVAYESPIGIGFIKKYPVQVMKYLIDTKDIPNISAVLEIGGMDAGQLSDIVDHAISKGETEAQVTISRYKNRHFGSAAANSDLML